MSIKPKYLIHNIVFLSFILRLVFFYFYPYNPLPDSASYFKAGEEFFLNGFTTNHKIMPLYPLWAITSNFLFTMPLLDILVSSATTLMVYKISIQLFNNKKAALIASFIYAIYPLSIFYSISGLSESLFVFLFLVGFYFANKQQLVYASLFWVLSILVRPTFDYLYPILIVYYAGGNILFTKQKLDLFRIGKNIGIYMATYVLLLAPWWVHNYNLYGQFVRLNLGFGQIIYEGNNLHNDEGGTYNFTGKNPYPDEIKSPLEINKILTNLGFNFIRANPKRFIKLSIKKFIRFWNPLPNHKTYKEPKIKLIIGLFTVPMMIGSLLLLISYFKKYSKKMLPLWMIIGYLTLINMITVASIRYRYPIEPFLIILSTFFFYRIFLNNQTKANTPNQT